MRHGHCFELRGCRRREGRTNFSRFFPVSAAKGPLEFAIELLRAFIADPYGCSLSGEIIADHQQPRLM